MKQFVCKPIFNITINSKPAKYILLSLVYIKVNNACQLIIYDTIININHNFIVFVWHVYIINYVSQCLLFVINTIVTVILK